MHTRVFAALVLVALVNTAQADEMTEIVDSPELPPSKSLSRRLEDKLDLLSDEFGLHLRLLSLDMLDAGWDVRGRTAYVRLDTGALAGMALRINGNIHFRGSYARVRATINLGFLGQGLRLPLPQFDVISQSLDGQRILVLRVPLIEGSF